jgi:hypothetical protein
MCTACVVGFAIAEGLPIKRIYQLDRKLATFGDDGESEISLKKDRV